MRTTVLAALALLMGSAATASAGPMALPSHAACDASAERNANAEEIRRMVQEALVRAQAAVEASRLDAETRAEVQAALAEAMAEVDAEFAAGSFDFEGDLSVEDRAEIQEQVDAALDAALAALETAASQVEDARQSDHPRD